jgi:hypothetical protein
MGEQVAQTRFAGVILGREEGDDFVETCDGDSDLLVLKADRLDDLVGFLLDASETFFQFLGHDCASARRAKRRRSLRVSK